MQEYLKSLIFFDNQLLRIFFNIRKFYLGVRFSSSVAVFLNDFYFNGGGMHRQLVHLGYSAAVASFI